ncbi:MAG: HEPN domain-containing protein [Bacteroidales bacterium]|nr:HEPN domain-containing protein [Bacteroidales bacterium]
MKEITKSWYQFAQKDLLAAKKLLETESLGNMALFHCQQSIVYLF